MYIHTYSVFRLQRCNSKLAFCQHLSAHLIVQSQSCTAIVGQELRQQRASLCWLFQDKYSVLDTIVDNKSVGIKARLSRSIQKREKGQGNRDQLKVGNGKAVEYRSTQRWELAIEINSKWEMEINRDQSLAVGRVDEAT